MNVRIFEDFLYLYIYSAHETKLYFYIQQIVNIKHNIDTKNASNGQCLSKCDMTCTQTVSQRPAMQKQYLSSFCSHLYT